MEWIGYFAAILIGLSLGLIGGGGAIFTVPLLVYFFKQDGLVASTGSLFIIGMTAVVGTMMKAWHRLVDFKMALLFVTPSLAGVYFSRLVLLPAIPPVLHFSDDLVITKPILILMIFSVLMIFASWAMIKPDAFTTKGDKKSRYNHPFFVGLKGFGVGDLTGFLGAGGGFLTVPVLVLFLNLPMRMAVGTSLAVTSVNSLFGFAISYTHHPLNMHLLVSLILLSVIGLLVGHRLSPHFSEAHLKKGFGYFILIGGIFLLIDQIFETL